MGHLESDLQATEGKKAVTLPKLGANIMERTVEMLDRAWKVQLRKDGSLLRTMHNPDIPIEHKGKAPGVDGKSVPEAYREYKKSSETIKRMLLEGNYKPSPLRRVEIPKGNGKTRKLGIPTARDRAVQQAVSMIMNPVTDRCFSKHSHGFRPNCSVYTAALQVMEFINRGAAYAVDVDIHGFFDSVEHDIIMSKLRQMTGNEKFLSLINKFLICGVRVHGKFQPTESGVPQGGVISPLLANIVLHHLDTELENDGNRFVRYADDFIVFSDTRRAATRIFRKVGKILSQLHLSINESKSSVVQVRDLEYLGFTFSDRIRMSTKSVDAFKQSVSNRLSRSSNAAVKKNIGNLKIFLNGWMAHYGRITVADQCRYIHKWLIRRITELHTSYRGQEPDPILEACRVWEDISLKYSVWAETLKEFGKAPYL